jgi:divalent metal cation (Fe/Co/Zn/Cd) transporter
MSTSPQAHGDADCCNPCAKPSMAPKPALSRNVALLQWVTITWMIVECAGSLWAAAQAHSVALLAFGADSLIELLSASVVLLQFLPRFPLKRTHAERIAAILLFALAIVVVGIAVLFYRNPMETSCLGIGVTIAALIAMPLLAWFKRREARAANDRALAADAAQSATCAYLAAVTLAGLLIFAV